jgi:hypothetical protein
LIVSSSPLVDILVASQGCDIVILVEIDLVPDEGSASVHVREGGAGQVYVSSVGIHLNEAVEFVEEVVELTVL